MADGTAQSLPGAAYVEMAQHLDQSTECNSPEQSTGGGDLDSKHCQNAFSSCKTLQEECIDISDLFKCVVCSKSCSTQENLQDHAKLHAGEQYPCLLCSKSFTSNLSLRTHLVSQHVAQYSVKCSSCLETFPSHSQLEKHVCTKQQMSTEWSEKGVVEVQLDDHLTIKGPVYSHDKENVQDGCEHSVSASRETSTQVHDNMPENCRLSLSTLNDVEVVGKPLQHQTPDLETHSGKSVERKSYLYTDCSKIHVDERTGADVVLQEEPANNSTKPPTCTVCLKVFRELRNLKAHMRFHTGYRPHKCHLCQKKFFRTDGLQTHLKQNNAKKPLRCPECHINFSLCSQLKAHVKEFHPEKYHSGYELQEAVGIKRVARKAEGKQIGSIKQSSNEDKSCTGRSRREVTIAGVDTSRMYDTSKNIPSSTNQQGNNAEKPLGNSSGESLFGSQSKEPTADAHHEECESQHSNSKQHKPDACTSFSRLSSDKPFKCHMCHRQFETDNALQVHLKLNYSKELLKCTLCNSNSSMCFVLKQHVEEDHGLNFESEYCHLQRGRLIVLVKKLKMQTSEACAEMPTLAKAADDDHVTNKDKKSSEGPLHHQVQGVVSTCPEPSEEIDYSGTEDACLSTGIDISFQKPRFQGSKSEAKSEDITKFGNTDDVSPRCGICKKLFCDIKNLMAHMRYHTGYRPHKCHLCQKRFFRSDGLQTHLEQNNAKKPLKCPVCPEDFSLCFQLKAHVQEIHPEMYHAGYELQEAVGIWKDAKRAEGQPSEVEETSSKTQSKGLEVDVLSMRCGICKKGFREQRNLTAHMRYHTGYRPHKCHLCQKRFFRSDSLQTHLKNNTAKKPLKCPECPEDFSLCSQLKAHVKTCHPEMYHSGYELQEAVGILRDGKRAEVQWSEVEERPSKTQNKDLHIDGEVSPNCSKHLDRSPEKESVALVHQDKCRSQHDCQSSRRHNSDVPFQCHMCHQQFETDDALDMHLRKTYGHVPFKCILCDWNAARCFKLKKHTEEDHGLNYESEYCQLSKSRSIDLQKRPQFPNRESHANVSALAKAASDYHKRNESESTLEHQNQSSLAELGVHTANSDREYGQVHTSTPSVPENGHAQGSPRECIPQHGNHITKSRRATDVDHDGHQSKGPLQHEVHVMSSEPSEEMDYSGTEDTCVSTGIDTSFQQPPVQGSKSETRSQQNEITKFRNTVFSEPEPYRSGNKSSKSRKECSYSVVHQVMGKPVEHQSSYYNTQRGKSTKDRNHTEGSKQQKIASADAPHHKERPKNSENNPSCNLCLKVFRNQKNLKAHMRFHTGHRPRKCHICQKRFFHSNGLQKHLKNNNAKKPLSCSECPKDFSVCSQLKAHVKECHPEMYHSGYELQEAVGILRGAKRADIQQSEVKESPLETQNIGLQVDDDSPWCGICKKGFSDHKCLKVHMRYHTGDRPYKCRICQKRFFHSSGLQKHLKKIKAKKPLECPECPKDFSLCSQLKAHVQNCHPEKYHSGYELQKAAGILRNANRAEVQQSKVEQSPLETHDYDCDAQCDRHVSSKLRATNVDIEDIEGHAPEKEQHNSICHIDDNASQNERVGPSLLQHECKPCKGRFEKNVNSVEVDQFQTCNTFVEVHSSSNHEKEKENKQNDKTSEKFSLCVQLRESITHIHHVERKSKRDNGKDERTSRRQCGDMPFECHMCHHRFKTDGALDLHLKQNFGIGSWKCKLCDWSSSMCFAVKKHEEEEHGLNYECEYYQLSEGRPSFLADSLEALTGEDCGEMTAWANTAPDNHKKIQSENSCQLPNQSLLQELDVAMDNPDREYAHILTSTNALLQNGPAERSPEEYLPQHGIQITKARIGANVDHGVQSSEGPLQYQIQVIESSCAEPSEEMDCSDTEGPKIPATMGTSHHNQCGQKHSSERPLQHQSDIKMSLNRETRDEMMNYESDCAEVTPNTHLLSESVGTVPSASSQEGSLENHESFSCDLCSRSFQKKYCLELHKRIHTGHLPFECPLCQVRHINRTALSLHLEKNNGGRPLKCPNCPQTYMVCSQMKEHISKKHREEYELQYAHCNGQDRCSENPEAQVAKSAPQCQDELFPQCDICQRVFRRSSHLSEHMRMHMGERPFNCRLCQQTFTRRGHLGTHLRKNNANKQLECPRCPQNFSVCSQLKEHMKDDHVEYFDSISFRYMNNRVGSLSEKSQKSGSTYNSQMTSVGNTSSAITASVGTLPGSSDRPEEAKASFKCDVCLQMFLRHRSLRDHMRSHSYGKWSKCTLCHERFPGRSNLYKHVNKNYAAKPLKCKICPETFPACSLLKKHMAEDHGEEYACEYQIITGNEVSTEGQQCMTNEGPAQLKNQHSKDCEERANQEENHIDMPKGGEIGAAPSHKHNKQAKHLKRKRTPEVPHSPSNPLISPSCDFCHKVFSSKNVLKQHMKLHTGEKNYKCQLCKERFYQSCYLQRHLRKNYADKLLQCPKCASDFPVCSELKKHIEDKHDVHWQPASNSIVHTKSSARKVTARGVSSSQTVNLQGPPAESTGSECSNSICSSCILCNVVFYNEQTLKEHMEGHASKKILQCVFCSEEFHSEESLQEHSAQNKACGVKCGQCREAFSNCALLQEHVENSHGKIIYDIPSTRSSKAVMIQPHESGSLTKRLNSQSKDQAKDKRSSVHSRNQEAQDARQQGHNCRVCFKEFEHFRDLQQHMESHCGGESLTGSHFFGKQMEREKMVFCDSEGTRYYQCPLCHKVCKRRHGLTHHMNHHKKSQREEQTPKESKSKKTRKQKGKQPLSCPMCERIYPNKSALRNHMAWHFKPFKCGICKRAFSLKELLQNHMKKHLGFKDAMCDICSKMFYSSSEVVKHKKHVHPAPADIDKYKCSHCQRTFSCRGPFNVHVKRHDKNRERLFVCHVCGSKFYTGSSLKSHLRTHTRERAFKCRVCDKSFIEKKHLTNHARLHTGETPWKCDICHMGFAQQAGLYWHKKRNKCETGN